MYKAKYLQPLPRTGPDTVLHLKLHDGPNWETAGPVLHAFDYSLNNHPGTLKVTAAYKHPGVDLDGDSDWIDIGAQGSTIKSIAMWVKPDAIDVTDYVIDLDGALYLTIVNGTLTHPGALPGTSILYVDGVVGTAITANWHLIVFTSTFGFPATDLDIGRLEGTGFFDGLVDDVRLLTSILTPAEILDIYNLTKWRYGR